MIDSVCLYQTGLHQHIKADLYILVYMLLLHQFMVYNTKETKFMQSRRTTSCRLSYTPKQPKRKRKKRNSERELRKSKRFYTYVPLSRPRRRSKRKKGRKERKLHNLRKNPTGTSICTRKLQMKFVVICFLFLLWHPMTMILSYKQKQK